VQAYDFARIECFARITDLVWIRIILARIAETSEVTSEAHPRPLSAELSAKTSPQTIARAKPNPPITRRRTMNRMISSVLSASALIFAQTAKELVGMLTLVSVTLEHDGKKTEVYGTNPQGQAKRLFKLPAPRLPVEHARVRRGARKR
jgi:hypothetical protein